MTTFEHEFFKMSAGGNDFIVFDNRDGVLRPDGMKEIIRKLCTRALLGVISYPG